MNNNSLGVLNDQLHEELERLSQLDVTDKDALDAEVKRAQAIGSIAKSITANANVVIRSLELRREALGTVSAPKMLDGN